MKKVLAIAVLGVLGLASCKKEYTCECSMGGYSVTAESGTKLKKKDAETWCNAGSVNGVTCKLK